MRGHALYMRAIHGAKAKNDRIDAFKVASLLRGGNMPVSYVYPAAMRATRDLLRRRLYLVRERGLLLAHVQNTHHQNKLPTPGASLPWRSNRAGVAEHFADECVRRTVEVDRSVVSHLDTVIREFELYLTNTTKEQDAESFHLLRSIPGVGKVLAMSILYESLEPCASSTRDPRTSPGSLEVLIRRLFASAPPSGCLCGSPKLCPARDPRIHWTRLRSRALVLFGMRRGYRSVSTTPPAFAAARRTGARGRTSTRASMSVWCRVFLRPS